MAFYDPELVGEIRLRRHLRLVGGRKRRFPVKGFFDLVRLLEFQAMEDKSG